MVNPFNSTRKEKAKLAKTVNQIEKLMKDTKDAFKEKIKTNEYHDILKVLTDSKTNHSYLVITTKGTVNPTSRTSERNSSSKRITSRKRRRNGN